MKLERTPYVEYRSSNGLQYWINHVSGNKISSNAPHLKSLLNLVDRKKNLQDIIKTFQNDPTTSALPTRKIIEKLVADGFFRHQFCIRKSSYLTRFESHLDYITTKMPRVEAIRQQQALKNIKIAIIGLGALGSHLAIQLAAIGVGKFILVDGDRIEAQNLARQVYYKECEIGKYKADTLKTRMTELSSFASVRSENSFIKSEDDFSAVKNADLIIMTADKPTLLIQSWASNFSKKNSIPIFFSGNGVIGPALIPGQEGFCFQCYTDYLRNLDSNLLADIEMTPDHPSLPSYVCAGYFIGAVLFHEIWEFLIMGQLKSLKIGCLEVNSMASTNILSLTACPTCVAHHSSL